MAVASAIGEGAADLEVVAEEEGEGEEEVSLMVAAAAVVTDTVDGENFLEAIATSLTEAIALGESNFGLDNDKFYCLCFCFYLYSFIKCGSCNSFCLLFPFYLICSFIYMCL